MTQYNNILHRNITINIPDELILPTYMSDFSKEENSYMLLVGSYATFTLKTGIIGTEKERDDNKALRVEYEEIIKCKDAEKNAIKNTFEEFIEKEQEKRFDKINEQIEKEKDKLSKESNKYQENIEQLQEKLKKIELENVKNEKIIHNTSREFENEVAVRINEQIEKEKEKMSKESNKYQEKIEQLQEMLKKAELENVKQEEINKSYKREMDNEVAVRINQKELEMIQEINKYKENLKNAEMKNELLNHTSREIDNEVAVRIKQNELEMMQEINKYKELVLQNKEKEDEKIGNLQDELAKMKAQMNTILIENEKDKNIILNESIQEMTKIMQDVKKQTNKTNDRGKEGEAYFFELAKNTFSEYDDFEICDKSKTPHSGDFHLKFPRFTIMVDTKCFIDTDVPVKDRKKLKHDITQNRHIKIAWLVSMHRPISKFSKFPFMIDIEDGICYVYINSLMQSENPSNLLKIAWHTSNIVYDLLNHDDDTLLLGKYKKNDIRVRDIISKMTIKSKERYAYLTQMKDNFDETDRYIRDLLNDEIINIRNVHEETIEKWWRNNMEKSEGGKLKTNIIYNAFCECDENKHCGIDIDIFKPIIKSMLNENDIVLGKTGKAQHTVLNYKIMTKPLL